MRPCLHELSFPQRQINDLTSINVQTYHSRSIMVTPHQLTRIREQRPKYILTGIKKRNAHQLLALLGTLAKVAVRANLDKADKATVQRNKYT